MAPRKAPAEQWWAVVTSDGALVSVGTVLADPLPEGLESVAVDGPGEGRGWDAQGRTWGDLPEPPPPTAPEPDGNAAIVAALGSIAANDDLDLTAKLTAMVEVLKQAAPAASTPEEGA